jgi:hypothetical protein
LTYLSVPFSPIEVNPLSKKEFKGIENVGETEEDRKYKKVPVAVFHGSDGDTRVNGSEDIVERVLASSDHEVRMDSRLTMCHGDTLTCH